MYAALFGNNGLICEGLWVVSTGHIILIGQALFILLRRDEWLLSAIRDFSSMHLSIQGFLFFQHSSIDESVVRLYLLSIFQVDISCDVVVFSHLKIIAAYRELLVPIIIAIIIIFKDSMQLLYLMFKYVVIIVTSMIRGERL